MAEFTWLPVPTIACPDRGHATTQSSRPLLILGPSQIQLSNSHPSKFKFLSVSLQSCSYKSGLEASIHMPPYYLHDCHYFYRTALRQLSVATLVAALYA